MQFRMVCLLSTQFQRKDIYKVTWRSNDGRTRNQIDHVMIDKKYGNCIYDVRSFRGTLHDSDHFLVKIKLRCKWPKSYNRLVNERPKFNVDRLKDSETKTRFQAAVEEQLKDEPVQQELNDATQKTNEIICKAASEVIGRATSKKVKGWFDEECEKAVNTKKEVRMKLLGRNSRSNGAASKRENVRTYRLLRRKKREHLIKEIETLEAHNRNGDVREFYRSVKKSRDGFKANSIKIRNENGDLLSDKKMILNRWSQYFQNLLNKPQLPQQTTQTFQLADPCIEEPSYEEVVNAINCSKDSKAPGEDNIPIELIKAAGAKLWERIHNIVLMVWNEEELPELWKTGVMIPIHKKGSKLICENYRGICLLNSAYKIFAKILYDRLYGYTEEIIGEYQGGFRQGRSTIDQIFTIRQIMEKSWEFNITIHQLFVDFKQAYDSLDRNVFFSIMEEFCIPMKLIRLTKATLMDTKCRILIQNSLSDPFDIDTGFKQGDRLSTLLFNLALEKVARAMSINWNGTILNTSKQLTAFADDTDLLGRGILKVKESFVEMDMEARKVGLVVSEDKTKYMVLDRSHGTRIGQNLTMNEYNFEVVQSFKYLGSIVNVANDLDEELKTRTIQANRCFYALKHLFRSKLLNIATKYRLYKTLVRTVAIYASETWTLTSNQENRLKCFERKIQRSICGPIKVNDMWRIRMNIELVEIFGRENIVSVIKSARLRWLGHVMRMSDDRVAKKVFVNNVEGTRPRGRPRKRWIDCVESDLKELGTRNWKVVAEDRQRWRVEVVESAKTRLG